MPILPFDVPVYRLAGQTNGYAYDDRNINYDEIAQAQQDVQPPLPGQGGISGGNTNAYTNDLVIPFDYGTNLWLQITNLDANTVSNTAFNVNPYLWFQLLSKTDLLAQVDWTVEQQIVGLGPTVGLAPIPKAGRPAVFFRGAQSDTLVSVAWARDAIRPTPPYYSGQPGYFTIYRSINGGGSDAQLPVYYQISGTASNGVDYTYLSGVTNLPEGYGQWSIEVDALPSLVGSNLTVTLTLVMTNGYLVDSNSPSATVVIEGNVFSQVASVTNAVGLAYHPPTQSLLVSAVGTNSPNVFLRIDSNAAVSFWAEVTNLIGPVTITTVKTTTNGFVEGDMYYDNYDGIWMPGIGWLSADATSSNAVWKYLGGYPNPIGGLYVDQTGAFGGDLIANVGGDCSYGPGGWVWQIDWSTNATPLTNFDYTLLGGVITLTNDVAQWGPWAGKIITGDDPESLLPNPQIYAIDTNGQYETFQLGIQAEHMDLIPPNQPFYTCDCVAGAVWKVPAAVFTNHVGHLLITGEEATGLFIVHWDAGITNFVVEKIATPDFVQCLEDGAFAPIELPVQSHQ